MKLAICGAWHVHAKDFIKIALEEKAEITGIYDENAELRHTLAAEFGLNEYESLDELLASDAESVAVAALSPAEGSGFSTTVLYKGLPTNANIIIKIISAKR